MNNPRFVKIAFITAIIFSSTCVYSKTRGKISLTAVNSMFPWSLNYESLLKVYGNKLFHNGRNLLRIDIKIFASCLRSWTLLGQNLTGHRCDCLGAHNSC